MSSRLGKWFEDLAINRQICNYEGTNPEQFDKLDQFAEIMKKRLDEHSWYLPVAYTPHDFSHHCKNVLTNASAILKESLDKFSIDELLALQYACILHDIDMVYNPYQREIHSLNGASILAPYESIGIKEEIQKEFNSHYQILHDINRIGDIPQDDIYETLRSVLETVSTFVDYMLNSKKLSRAVSRIILGHSDIKIDKLHRINTLDDKYYNDFTLPHGPNQTQMKLRILAAVLRVADELDCSQQRIEGITIPSMPSESKKHWEKLELIGSVTIAPVIKLSVDKYCKNLRKEPSYAYEMLFEIEQKINQELKTMQKCFGEENFPILFSEAVIDFKDSSYTAAYEKYKQEVIQRERSKEGASERRYDVERLIKQINQTIEDKGLHREVHRRLSGKSMRNHIDCNDLLTRHQILDGVSQVFLNAMLSESGDFAEAPSQIPENEYAIVGVANSGAVIAAHMSLLSGIPAVYYVPTHKKSKYSSHETDLESYTEILNNRKVVLVIGVNHTGSAIQDAQAFVNNLIDQNKIQSNVCCVLGIINREQDGHTVMRLKGEEIKVGFLITDYPIEWCSFDEKKLTCPYGKKCYSDEEGKL